MSELRFEKEGDPCFHEYHVIERSDGEDYCIGSVGDYSCADSFEFQPHSCDDLNYDELKQILDFMKKMNKECLANTFVISEEQLNELLEDETEYSYKGHLISWEKKEPRKYDVNGLVMRDSFAEAIDFIDKLIEVID